MATEIPASGWWLGVDRRSILKLLAAFPFAPAGLAGPVGTNSIQRYIEGLARSDGGFAWPDDPDSTLTSSFAAIACCRLLSIEPAGKADLARFIRGAYPMPDYRRKDRPQHWFDYEQIQSLAWLGESLDEFRRQAEQWVGPTQYTKYYELGENPVLRHETGAIFSRRLLGLPSTEAWRAYILSRRRSDGSFNNTPGADGSDGHATNTWLALSALDALGVVPGKKQETAEWLRACQMKNGGFTYAPHPALSQDVRVDYTWASLKALKSLGAGPKDPAAARAYLISLWNRDGGFGDRPGRASNPVATWQALDALALLGPVAEIRSAHPHVRAAEPAIPQHLKVHTIQIEAPGVGNPAIAAEMARELKVDLWGAKNSPAGWIARAQQIANAQKIPVTFFASNEEYGTYVEIPGLGAYSHLSDIIAPAGSDFGSPMSQKDKQPARWQDFVARRIAPLRRAGGNDVWQFNENEELSLILLDEAVRKGTFSAICTFHFGKNQNFLREQPFLNRYRDVMPFVALQDTHTQTWWWMEFLVGYRTLFLAEQPTWEGWLEALRRNWVVDIRHDSTTDFRTQVAGGSNAVRKYVMDRQAQWRWWGNRPDRIQRPWASLVAVTPEDTFEAARPREGVSLHLRCWWDTQPFGTPKFPVVELVTLEIDGAKVEPELVHTSPARSTRGDVYYEYPVAAGRKGRHTATATVRMIKTGVLSKVTRQFTI
ncbi:MAG: prenyltransferase [Acidobacteria bacterium]|nr:prenyltransferase [Acidobacteriota bacterium]